MGSMQADPGISHEGNAMFYIGGARQQMDARNEDPAVLAALARAEAALAVADSIRELADAVREVTGVLPPV
jgi:hypothetical protein